MIHAAFGEALAWILDALLLAPLDTYIPVQL
jgi:hypothetical protein